MTSNTVKPENGGSRLPRSSHAMPGFPSNNFIRDKPYSLNVGGTASRIKSSNGGLPYDVSAWDGGGVAEVG